jgi:hypothetical protein
VRPEIASASLRPLGSLQVCVRGHASNASRERREALLSRFLAAVRAGDVEALVGLLAADAVSYADGGGKARATPLPIHGAAKVARLWASLGTGQGPYALRTVDVNGQPGAAATGPDGTLLAVLTLDIADERVQAVRAVSTRTSWPAPLPSSLRARRGITPNP